jgi:dihydroorotase
MVHITLPGVPLDGVFDRLRPGDVITHLLHGRGETVVRNGRVLASLRRAVERGVGADVGHGMGSFAFATARAAQADGFAPLTISTDLHAYDVDGPVYDLPTTLSKFLALGMSLDAVVAAATVNAAASIGMQDQLGSLAPGRVADLAVFELAEGDFPFVDAQGETLQGRQKLQPVLTVRAGDLVASDLP